MEKKRIALTFDDGHSNITHKVLDILENNGIVGSFFIIGENINETSRETFKRQLSLGCEICNHSMTHNKMTTLTPEQMRKEIEDTSALIKDYAGVEPKFFRPPFIDVNDIMYENINLPFICGVDSHDWDPEVSVEGRIENILSGACDGAIILMHDFTDNFKTLEMLPIVIAELKKQNYEFLTVSDLFKSLDVDPMNPRIMWSTLK